jgi:NADPH-dependent 2,4-dienoyl-CoA reductase/sulfur reductase-like enzyme/rhodanese-related sulfurtransferase
MSTRKIVIIGGSAAGAKAAARARRLDQRAEITIVQKAPDLSMAACGYPYYVGGVFNDRNLLLATPTGVTRNAGFFHKTKRITALVETEVIAIDRRLKVVNTLNLKSGETSQLDYDTLILCTGARASTPPLPGLDLQGVTTLLSMQDTDYLRMVRDEQRVKEAVIIGGGLIGVETCEALQLSGIQVTMVEFQDQLLSFLDWDLARIMENHIAGKSARVITGQGVKELQGENGNVTAAILQDGRKILCQLAVLAVGVRPNSELAESAGLAIGSLGGILVDDCMRTSDPDIYAAGDCVEIRNILTGKNVLAPMGDLANLQGRVAGENAVTKGRPATFPGTIQTGICKVFDFNAGATGLSEKAAKAMGMTDYETVINAGSDKPGFMGGKLLVSKMLIDKTDRRILGYQCVGPGDVSRQISMAAMAIQGRLSIDAVACADLPYAPPFSPAIDHFIATAHIMQNKLAGRFNGISSMEVWQRYEKGERPFFIDGRGPDEYEQLRLGIGEILIPVGALRERLGELPDDRTREIICFCKISLRGYETALILEDRGYTNVRVMEGGIMAWPYPREK